MELRGKRVLVMGLGLHGGGLGVTRWLVEQGAHVTVTDLKKPEDLAPTLEALARGSETRSGIEFVLGEHREKDFISSDLIVRNPGVPRESKFLRLAQEHGVPIRMEMGLFFEQLPRGGDQVIGITGTKGKTTTTMMVGAILKKAKANSVVAGNLRVSALEMLDQIQADTTVVLELSSFQLEEFDALGISPRIAAITNISPDHLNRYAGMDEYTAAKANIFSHQGISDYTILNFDSPTLTRLRPRVHSRVVWFSRTRPLNDGALVENGTIVWKREGQDTLVLPVAELGTVGTHNLENALAATAVAKVWGASTESIAQALREFKGAPDRLEVVRVVGGVTYINDTTATAPAATVAALNALNKNGRNIVLIAGGSDKGLDYTEMAQTIANRSPRVVLVQDSATPRIEQALVAAGASKLILGKYDRFEDAVSRAHELAHPGDTVLLSPGAASFGMFPNEFKRGDKFREIVMRFQ